MSSSTSSSSTKSRRHSHEPHTLTEMPTNFRHTQSQHYSRKIRKVHTKAPEPPIFEMEDTVALDSQQIRISITNTDEMNRDRSSRQSHTSHAYENMGFETDLGGISSRTSSAANSIRSSVRNPSLQSLSTIKEQYWCCSQRSPCERILFATVGVLVFIILILATTVGILAASRS